MTRAFSARLSSSPGLAAQLAGLATAIAFVTVLSFALKYDSLGAAFLLDHQHASIFPYPFTIQNATYVVFASGLADLYVRWRAARHERSFLRRGFLPEDDSSILQIADLGPIRRKVVGQYDAESGFLPYLIDISITQLQASRSVDQAVVILTSSLDLLLHKVDLRYQTVRYIAWLVPTIGFMGTIIGISAALDLIKPQKLDLSGVTGALGVAFYTTLVALLASAVIVLLQHVIQREEESALNEAGQYCLKNLINRLYVPREPAAHAERGGGERETI